MTIHLAQPPRKILIIKPSSLGDIVHSLPFLAVLKKTFPEAELHWVVARGLQPFLAGHPLIDKLWIFDKDNWKKLGRLRLSLGEISTFVRGLRETRFDLAIDLSGLLRSGLIAWAAKIPCRIGFRESDEGSPFFYTHKVTGGRDNHAIDRYLRIAEALGGVVEEIVYPLAPFAAAAEITRQLPREYVVMAPAAGKEANRWPAARFGELAARLPWPTVLLSSPGDKAVVAEVLAHSQGKALSLAGQTGLQDLTAVIGGARFFVCNDTGPMHIAAACQIPVFAIFGPANPARTGPYGKIHTVIQEQLACIPCYRWRPCSHWRCMLDLTVDKVLAVIRADPRFGQSFPGRD